MAEYFIGEIRLLAFNRYVPRDFLPCDGRLLPISGNEALFTVLGTTYGGDGTSSFALPDLRGRSPVAIGQPPGSSTSYALGQAVGAEQVALTEANLPAHSHAVSVTTGPATTVTPAPNVAHANVAGNFLYVGAGEAGTVQTLAAATVGMAGGNANHTNIQPSLPLQYVIAVQGIYPDFN